MNDDLLYKIALNMITGVGGITAKKLMSVFGSPQAVFEASDSQFLKATNNAVAKNFNKSAVLKQAEQELKFVETKQINVLFYTDKDYPDKLKHCDDSPVTLFTKGSASLNNAKTISIVGTRRASHYGLSLCRKFVAELADKGYRPLIVSGLAFGIDVCAHTAALECGLETAAIMGTALNRIYPAAHSNIAAQIEKQGAIVTEYCTSSPVASANFVSRNRIVAGIADVTIIVESSNKGGALVTASIANSYNREVMAFPGRVGDELSQGCNRLIKQNRAALLESVDDLEYLMNWSAQQKPVQKEIDFAGLTQPEQELLAYLHDKEAVNIDIISRETDIPMPALSALLLNLEFSGLIVTSPGNSYSIRKF
jgi:DNA processing protein